MNPAPSASIRKELFPTNQAGFLLIEIILSGALFLLLVAALGGTLLYAQQGTTIASTKNRALFIAEEGLEATRNIRDENFANLTNGNHGIAISANKWAFSGSSDVTDGFTRTITVSTVDSETKLIVSNVTWKENQQRNGSSSLSTRLTNWRASSIGNWALPTQLSAIDLAGSSDGVKITMDGNYAYAVMSGGSPDFYIINIANPLSPSVVGSLTLSGTPTDIAVSGNYAYVSSTDDSQELQIINISTPSSPSLVGTYNASGSANATGVVVNDTVVYLVRVSSGNDELLSINITTPSTPSLLDSLDLGTTVNDIAISGSYAYIATDKDSSELEILNISNPSSLTLDGSFNLPSSTNANTLAAFGTTVVIGQGALLYTINAAVPSASVQLGSYNTGGTINDISLGINNTYAFIADSKSSGEFQIINITTPSSPTALGSFDISGGNPLQGVVYDITQDQAYAIGSSNSQEFTIFTPQ